MKTYCLGIDYKEFKPNTYKGVCIYDFDLPEKKKEIIRVNTGSPELDVKRAVRQLEEVIDEDECKLIYLSSHDDYFTDLDIEK